MPDRKHDGSGRSCNRPEIVRKREDRPAVLHSAERGVLRIGERSLVNELCADDNVLPSLICRAGGLQERC